ncbi:hypothetical protein FNV43_RR18941 [Rhamnella rubrinervis]|uniref:Glycosyltransferase n=1 Tax=Rhamnella rubrinervis TaxID=2594499 RepID=A0A8K0DZX3_9ROSA|nr:hypothetical protein FNV43_RR18941 [Rhamnella rubrinervis]
MNEMEKSNTKPHAVLFCYPLQGHVIPSVHLAVKLASKGFTITFVNTKYIHHHINKSKSKPNHTSKDDDDDEDDIFAGIRNSTLDIRYATIDDGYPLGFDRSLNHDQFWDGFKYVFPAHVDELVGNIVRKHSQPPLTCLIADTFFTWSSMIASKYNLVNISFWTEPALVLTLYYHLDLLIQNRHFGASHDNRKDTIDYIPGVPEIDPKDLMSYLQATDPRTTVHKIIFRAFADVKKADFIVINTVQELESMTISALQQKQPTYAIGPIFPSGFAKSIVPTSLWSESHCTHEWLSTKPHNSVLYVSFGSYAHACKKDIEEIAEGLLLSKVSFIWVLRPDIVSSDENDILPVGYEEAIKGRGLIVPWCSQIEVISHPAIGGFITHCGWNSILESIWCKIPLLAYPLLTDQFTNRKLVVDDWKIGVNLIDSKPINRKEIAEKINRVMSGKLGDELKKNIMEARNCVENALGHGGSSETMFSRFLSDVNTQIEKLRGV